MPNRRGLHKTIVTARYSCAIPLDEEKRSYQWDFDPNDFGQDCIHTLFVKQAILGPEAKEGEVNEVQISTTGYREVPLTLSIAVLQEGTCMQSTTLQLEFTHPPITFTLVKGTGPVFVLGTHLVEFDDSVPLETLLVKRELQLFEANELMDESDVEGMESEEEIENRGADNNNEVKEITSQITTDAAE